MILMENETLDLLKQCNSGCKMATNSMEQVMEYIMQDKLKEVIDKYNRTHIKIGEECTSLLEKEGSHEEDPSPMAKAFSYISTEAKLLINDDAHQIASLLIDGCNMGIKSVSEAINKNTEASKESISLAKRLVKEEQDFMDELKEFL